MDGDTKEASRNYGTNLFFLFAIIPVNFEELFCQSTVVLKNRQAAIFTVLNIEVAPCPLPRPRDFDLINSSTSIRMGFDTCQ